MKHRILDIDAGLAGQRCARLYGTTTARIHDDLCSGCLTGTPGPRWQFIPRLQHQRRDTRVPDPATNSS